MERPLLAVLGHHIGGRLFVVLWGGMAAASLTLGPADLRLALVLALIGGCALGLPALEVLAVAGVGWLVLDGFVAHSYGELAFAGTDLALLPVVLVTAGAAALVSGVRR